MLVSTFELLVKPIAPAGAGPASLGRTVVQGYFLTIANTTATEAGLRLRFRATTPNLDLANTIVIQDIVGTNSFGELTPTSNPQRFRYDITIPANDTALITLLPDVSSPPVVAGKNLEIRGFVEVIRRPVPNTDPLEDLPLNLLLTPEHRGTFFSGDPAAPAPDIDQLAYALPTATGRALYTLD
jgi:hypothetical protein